MFPDLRQEYIHQRALEAEALVASKPNAASAHEELVQSQLSRLSGLEAMATGEEAKSAFRTISMRYRAELAPSLQNAGPRPGPTSSMLRALTKAEAEETNVTTKAAISGFAEWYRDMTEQTLDMMFLEVVGLGGLFQDLPMGPSANPGTSQALRTIPTTYLSSSPNRPPGPAYLPSPTAVAPPPAPSLSVNDKVYQKALRTEALLAAHRDAASLHAEMFRVQIGILSGLEAAVPEEEARVEIRAISTKYRAEMSLPTVGSRRGPVSTILQILARAEAEETNMMKKVFIGAITEGYREMTDRSLDELLHGIGASPSANSGSYAPQAMPTISSINRPSRRIPTPELPRLPTAAAMAPEEQHSCFPCCWN